jgi:hypothetical protein
MRVIGIHPIEARQPVHLVEVEAQLDDMPIVWESITQPLADKEQSYWQVPYDELKVPDVTWRWCFLFHFLDLARPLASHVGDLELPAPTPVPEHLRFVRYEEP